MTTITINNNDIPECFDTAAANPIIDPTQPDTLHITFNDVGLSFDLEYDQQGIRFVGGNYFYEFSKNETLGQSILGMCPTNAESTSLQSALLLYFPEKEFSIMLFAEVFEDESFDSENRHPR